MNTDTKQVSFTEVTIRSLEEYHDILFIGDENAIAELLDHLANTDMGERKIIQVDMSTLYSPGEVLKEILAVANRAGVTDSITRPPIWPEDRYAIEGVLMEYKTLLVLDRVDVFLENATRDKGQLFSWLRSIRQDQIHQIRPPALYQLMTTTENVAARLPVVESYTLNDIHVVTPGIQEL